MRNTCVVGFDLLLSWLGVHVYIDYHTKDITLSLLHTWAHLSFGSCRCLGILKRAFPTRSKLNVDFNKVSGAHLQIQLLLRTGLQWMITGRTMNIFPHQRKYTVLTAMYRIFGEFDLYPTQMPRRPLKRGWAISGSCLNP